MADIKKIDDKDKKKRTYSRLRWAIVQALLSVITVFCIYIGVSLTDIWGYFPPIMQAMAYGLVIFLIIGAVVMGGLQKSILSLKATIQILFLAIVMTSILFLLVGSDSKRLIEIALKPRAIFSYPLVEIRVTVIPPDYSGRTSFTEELHPNVGQVLGVEAIPEGSLVVVRIANTPYAPRLIAGHQTIDFLAAENTDENPTEFVAKFGAQFTGSEKAVFSINEGRREIGKWPMVMLEDDAPNIKSVDYIPIMTADGLFGLSLDISDDYGIKYVTVGVVPAGVQADLIDDQIRLSIWGLREFKGNSYVNLSASSYAGELVDIVVDVVDGAGHTTRKVIANIALPKRIFTNLFARNIIEVRRKIQYHWRDRGTENIRPLQDIMLLGEISDNSHLPPIYYTALRSAYWRVAKPKDAKDLNSARDILWDLADDLDGNHKAVLKGNVLAHLAALKLALHQRQDVVDIKKQIVALDGAVLVFLRAQKRSDFERYDVKMLRRLYEKILTQSYYGKYNAALDLTSYCEQGFIYSDSNISYFSPQPNSSAQNDLPAKK